MPNAETSASLLRLSESLQSLLHSVDGHDVEESDPSGGQNNSTPPDSEDWVFHREALISQLEAENAELRRTLNIDSESISVQGFNEDDFRELPLIRMSSRPGSTAAQPNLYDWISGGSPPPNPPPPFQTTDSNPPSSISLQRPIELQQLTDNSKQDDTHLDAAASIKPAVDLLKEAGKCIKFTQPTTRIRLIN